MPHPLTESFSKYYTVSSQESVVSMKISGISPKRAPLICRVSRVRNFTSGPETGELTVCKKPGVALMFTCLLVAFAASYTAN